MNKKISKKQKTAVIIAATAVIILLGFMTFWAIQKKVGEVNSHIGEYYNSAVQTESEDTDGLQSAYRESTGSATKIASVGEVLKLTVTNPEIRKAIFSATWTSYCKTRF